MLGDLDPFDFILAEKLGKTVGELMDMPNDEYIKWRAFFSYRAAMQNMKEPLGEVT